MITEDFDFEGGAAPSAFNFIFGSSIESDHAEKVTFIYEGEGFVGNNYGNHEYNEWLNSTESHERASEGASFFSTSTLFDARGRIVDDLIAAEVLPFPTEDGFYGTGYLDIEPEEIEYNPTTGTFGGVDFLDVGPDTPEYDLVILTDFSHGTSSTQVSSEDLIIADVVANGTIVPGGNWSVATTIANESGIFATPSGIAADWNSPGRGTVLDDLSDNVSTIHNDFYGGFVEVSPGVYEHPDVVVAMPSSDITSSFVSINQFAEIDPLVLDLDGDGIELTPFNEHNIYFDVDNDGAIERTGWVGADDGILVHDLNGDGEINNITETLSEYYGAPEGTGAIYGNGFEALATLDSNNDGIIDASDTQFSTLRVWQDANSDAQTDAGELISLAEAGITSIDLNNTEDGALWRLAA